MVTFEIMSKSKDKVTYKYFPENDKNSDFGIFTIELTSGEVNIDKVAERDYKSYASVEELNFLRDAINNSRIESGEDIMNDEELPEATEDEEWYHYADHAIQKVQEDIKNNNIPEFGESWWY